MNVQTMHEGVSSSRDRPLDFRWDRLQRLSELERWHFWFEGRKRLLARLMAQYLPSPASPAWLAEIGCGTGHTLRQLHAKGFCRLGLDQHQGFTADSEVQFLQGNAERLPLRNQSLKALCLFDLLEHVDDRAVLVEANRVLEDGGRVFLTVPAMPWLWSFRDEDAGHRRRYSRKSLIQVLQASGFEIDTVHFYQFFLFPLLALTRIFGKRRAFWRNSEERPGRWMNRVFKWINLIEVKLGEKIRWPWGSSLIAVCHKTSS